MTDVISIKFKNRGKIYFFDPAGIEVPTGKTVVVETSKGLEMGECVKGNHAVEESSVVSPLRPVVRIATADDHRVAGINREREKEAMDCCRRKIEEHGLDMKLVDVECNFEGNKILFFFTSDGRVDFRELVKDLASIYRTRIELRQIGVRDETKMIGGIGICGRPYCCSQFLDDFQPVSTKMAKTQSLSLNPTKISGACGRLMCCLRYEQEAYESLVKTVPKNGAFVETPVGYGNVTQVNVLRQKVKVNLDGQGETTIKLFDADEVAAVPGGRPKAGEPLPKVLQLKVKPEEPEPDELEEDGLWSAPDMIAGQAGDEAPADAGAENGAQDQQPRQEKRSRRSRGGKKPAGERKDAHAPQKGERQSAEKQGAGDTPPAQKQAPKQPNKDGQKPQNGSAEASGKNGQKRRNNYRRRRPSGGKGPSNGGGGRPSSEG